MKQIHKHNPVLLKPNCVWEPSVRTSYPDYRVENDVWEIDGSVGFFCWFFFWGGSGGEEGNINELFLRQT